MTSASALAGKAPGAASKTLNVFFCCTGVGIFNRGIESFFREAFDGLQGTPGLDITLYKGAGEQSAHERTVWSLPRTGAPAKLLGRLIRRNGYVVEQLSSLLPLTAEIRRRRPDVIFSSDGNLCLQLYRRRQRIGVPFRLLFSNGGPCTPPFFGMDYVHQVAPYYLDLALNAGVSPAAQSMVPYGIDVPEGEPESDDGRREAIREKLGLPVAGKIVVSVGLISATHKRMDYTIRELASLPEPRPHLCMIGNMDESSASVLKLATEALGANGFTARSVPYREVADYYRAADVFVLSSLKEGFGRVYLEALIHGLPCAVHDHPVMRYVLGDEGRFSDLSSPGSLAPSIRTLLDEPRSPAAMSRRRESVRRRFSWPALAPAYRQMFLDCAARGENHDFEPRS